jgi:hypothetical protein
MRQSSEAAGANAVENLDVPALRSIRTLRT